MQLPDEAIEFNYNGALLPHSDAWTPLAELQAKNYLRPERVEAVKQQLCRSATGRGRAEMTNPPPKMLPLDNPRSSTFRKSSSKHYRRKGDSERRRPDSQAAERLKAEVDRVVVLGIGGSYLGARALFDALCHTYHNELPDRMRMGRPRLYFEGNNLDNDSLQDLLELLENTCVDPNIREERWGPSSSASRAARWRRRPRTGSSAAEAGPGTTARRRRPPKNHVVPITGPVRQAARSLPGGRVRRRRHPDHPGRRRRPVSACSRAVGLLPAAVMGLDVPALLLGPAR